MNIEVYCIVGLFLRPDKLSPFRSNMSSTNNTPSDAQSNCGCGTNNQNELPPKILFLCTHNACRSQLAEGLTKSLYGDKVIVESAGSNPGSQVNASAIKVLNEIGIDISGHIPKHLKDVFIDEDKVDYVITLCSNDGDGCPTLGRRKVGKYIHHIFDDPSHSPAEGEDGLGGFRRVRDEIEQFLRKELPISHLLDDGFVRN